jgi:hypothetical protein
VRWQQLFDDLEAQLEAQEAAEFQAEVSDRTRYEIGRLRLVDRLRPAVGREIEVRCLGAGSVRGRLARVGADWVLLEEEAGRQGLLSCAAVMAVAGLGAVSTTPGSEGVVQSRLDLRHAVRGVARDRSQVQAVLLDGSTVAGTVDRVGADFVELAEHPEGEPRRAVAVRRVRTVPVSALALVRVW